MLQPLAELPAQAATQVLELPAQAAKQVFQPLAELLPAQAAKQVLELPAQAAKEVFRPLAELLPAQAAAELVQPGPGAALAELHNTSKRRWTRIRTRIRIQKTSQPLAELQHQWSWLQPLAENQTVKVIPTRVDDGVDGVNARAQPKNAVTVLKSLHHHAHDDERS